jgi:hypothetical protein
MVEEGGQGFDELSPDELEFQVTKNPSALRA